MIGLAMSYGWACDPIAIFMPFGANAARVHSERRLPRVVYLTSVGLALGVSLLVSFWFSLKLAYAAGGYNFDEWVFRRGGQVRWTVLSLFVAWMVKSVIIRLGGLALFERAKPLFVGMVVGHFMAAGFLFVIDAIWFEGQGHSLYF